MDALKVLKERRSVRKFKDKLIDDKVLLDILLCAKFAPSANNLQPWHFVVVTSRKMLRKIAILTDYGKFIANCAACIVVCSEPVKYFLEDCSAATENILLAAKAYGLGSYWVAGHKKKYAEKIKKLLWIPPKYKLVSLIALGYAAGKLKPHSKKRLEEVLHWEKF